MTLNFTPSMNADFANAWHTLTEHPETALLHDQQTQQAINTLESNYQRPVDQWTAMITTAAFQRRMITPTLSNIQSVKAGKSKGLILHYRFLETPWGLTLLARHQDAICYLQFVDVNKQSKALMNLHKRYPGAEFKPGSERDIERIDDTLSNLKPKFLLLDITPFQLKIYQALNTIPSGAVTTYDRLAGAAGSHGAARAAGSAMANNPIVILLPCHRVIRGDMTLGKYSGGGWRKPALLAHEALLSA